jgi:hypothetical protein
MKGTIRFSLSNSDLRKIESKEKREKRKEQRLALKKKVKAETNDFTHHDNSWAKRKNL